MMRASARKLSATDGSLPGRLGNPGTPRAFCCLRHLIHTGTDVHASLQTQTPGPAGQDIPNCSTVRNLVKKSWLKYFSPRVRGTHDLALSNFTLLSSHYPTVRLGGMGTGISEASKRVPIFSFATQGGKQVSSYF